MAGASEQAIFEALQAKYGKRIAQAFIAAMNELRSGVDLQRLIKAISDGDIQAAEAALHLDPAALAKLKSAIGDTYTASGEGAAKAMPVLKDAAGARFLIRFNPGNLRAEEWLRTQSSNLITNILEDQRSSVREALSQGIRAGDNPRTTALDIVGRIDATGQRSGGIVGLSQPQADYLESARAELASTDPAMLRNYLTRTLRDKRYDSAVTRAIETGEAIPQQTQDAAITSYSNRLLKLRGDTIARTETISAIHAGQDEAYQQAIDKGAVAANQVRSVWHSAEDTRVRLTHAILDGESKAHGEPFVTVTGQLLRYPGDTGLGAGPQEVINCRCWLSKRIDFLANIR